MAEKPPESEKWEIERPDKTTEVDIGGNPTEFSYSNTTIYRFMGAWAMADHIFRTNPDGRTGTFYFGSTEFMQQLDEAGYPIKRDPYPTDSDVEAFRRWERSQLEDELKQLGEE